MAERVIDYISGIEVPATPEEIEATQVFSKLLVEDYGYPKEHIQTRPQFRVKVRPSDTKKEYPVDIAVFSDPNKTDDNIYIIVECKKKNRKDGKGQLEDYLRLSKASLGVWFNGAEVLYLRKYETDGKVLFTEIPNIPLFGQRVEDVGLFKRGELKKTHNLKSIFKNIRNYLAANNTGQTLDTEYSDELEIPFTLPANIERTNYTIQVYPAGQKDAFDSDNEAILTVGFADISIDNIQESRAETGRTLMVTVKNKGYTPVNSATLKFFKATDKMTLISTEHIASLNPGVEEVFTFNIGMDEFYNDVSGEASSYYFLIETEELESDCGNNSEFVYLYPDYDITLIAGTGGNVSGGGTYVKGDDAILIATPSSGYIFDGWYENGERLYGVSNECKITVDSNRTLEARFKKNDLQITDVEIFGTLSAGETISFTVSATGGVQPWQWEFYIQSDNEVVYSDNAAIVNFTEWTPSQSGTYDFLAFVTDATGKRISYRTQFVVS